MTLRHGETVTVLRPGGRKPNGDRIPGPPPFDVPGWAIAPRSSSESDDRGSSVIVGLSLFGPYDADIRPDDQVRVRGVVYDVVGEPGRWRNPMTGREAGLEVAVTRTS